MATSVAVTMVSAVAVAVETVAVAAVAIGIAWFLVFRCCCCVALRSRMFDAVRWDLELLWCVFFSVSRYVGHLLLRWNGVLRAISCGLTWGGLNLWFSWF